jgi:hypothetical protein
MINISLQDENKKLKITNHLPKPILVRIENESNIQSQQEFKIAGKYSRTISIQQDDLLGRYYFSIINSLTDEKLAMGSFQISLN